MPVERIDCASDPRVAAWREVRDGELLRARGLFVAEGRLVVRRVLDDGRYRVHSLLVNDAALHDLSAPLASIADDVPVFVCSAAGLAGIAGYHVHRGCLALVHRPPSVPIDEIIARRGNARRARRRVERR